MNTHDFLETLFGGCDNGNITITTLPSKKNYHIPVAEIDRAAEIISSHQNENIFYGTALRNDGLAPSTRGKVEDVHSVVCFFADIDIQGEAHKEMKLPATMEEVNTFLSDLNLPPTIIINSGHGVHAIWCLDHPFVIDSEEDRKRITSMSSAFGNHIKKSGLDRGWKLDFVQDITRMLRLPGSLNHKENPPIPCEVAFSSDTRYPLSAFEAYQAPPEQPTAQPMAIETDTMGSADRMRGKCAFIDYCIENAAVLSEPEWYSMISIVALTADGAEKAHEWSEAYPGYDPDETMNRFNRAVMEKHPRSCSYIRQSLGFSCPEDGCVCGDRTVRCPLSFATLTMPERIDRLLGIKLTMDEALKEENLKLVLYAQKHQPTDFIRLKKKYQAAGIGVNDLKRSLREVEEKEPHQASAIEDFSGSTNIPELSHLTIPDGWVLSISGISHVETSKGVPRLVEVASAPVYISKKLEYIDTDMEKLELTFYRNNRWKTTILPRNMVMDKGKLIQSASTGIAVNSGNAADLVAFLAAFEAENDVPIFRTIDHVGWVGKNEFYPFRVNGEVVYDNKDDEGDRLVKAITTEGNYETWKEMAIKLHGMPFARVMLAASYASVLVEPLQLRNIYLHVWCDSRSGKTACAKAAASIWGDPKKLMVSYNSTQVGFERMAGAMRNLPLFLDELQSLALNPDYLSHIVYMLGNGIGKIRGDRFGGTQPLQRWNNAIISTGEQPITNDSSMDGESSRVLELSRAPITDSDFGKEVHQISESNFGFAGQDFMKYLFEHYPDMNALKEVFNDTREILEMLYDLYENHDPGPHLDTVAALVMSDAIASQAIHGIEKERAESDANVLGVKLLSVLNQEKPLDSIDRAWAVVRDWVAANQDHFEKKNNYGSYCGKTPFFGRYEDGKLYIIPHEMKVVLDKAGFSYEKSVHGFKRREYIAEKQVQKRINGASTKTICADIQLQLIREDEDQGARQGA